MLFKSFRKITEKFTFYMFVLESFKTFTMFRKIIEIYIYNNI